MHDGQDSGRRHAHGCGLQIESRCVIDTGNVLCEEATIITIVAEHDYGKGHDDCWAAVKWVCCSKIPTDLAADT